MNIAANLLYIFEFVIDTLLQMSLFNFIFLSNLLVYVIFLAKMVFPFSVIFIGFIYTKLCLYAILLIKCFDESVYTLYTSEIS